MIKTLDDLLQSPEYNGIRFGSSNDDWFHDQDRMQRCHDAAENGGDGSTYGEHIQDWRECLDNHFSLDEETTDSISAEIDSCEEWHVENGSIDEEIG
jgi:hypothetical protein